MHLLVIPAVISQYAAVLVTNASIAETAWAAAKEKSRIQFYKLHYEPLMSMGGSFFLVMICK